MQNNSAAVKISGYRFVAPNREDMLMKAVSRQPVAVGIQICDRFRHYESVLKLTYILNTI